MSRPQRPRIETDAGTEIQCSMCKDFWPCDPEFFYFFGGKPHAWCKACYASAPSVLAKRQRSTAKVSAARATRQLTHVPQERTLHD